MQIRNNYDMIWRKEPVSGGPVETGAGIYNGDIGYILAIDAENETLTVDFDGRIAAMSFDALVELEHAWAITVHKSQGSEYRAVVLANRARRAPPDDARRAVHRRDPRQGAANSGGGRERGPEDDRQPHTVQALQRPSHPAA